MLVCVHILSSTSVLKFQLVVTRHKLCCTFYLIHSTSYPTFLPLVPKVSFKQPSYRVNEGGSVTIGLQLDRPPNTSVTVTVATMNGTACKSLSSVGNTHELIQWSTIFFIASLHYLQLMERISKEDPSRSSSPGV